MGIERRIRHDRSGADGLADAAKHPGDDQRKELGGGIGTKAIQQLVFRQRQWRQGEGREDGKDAYEQQECAYDAHAHRDQVLDALKDEQGQKRDAGEGCGEDRLEGALEW